MTRPSRLCPGLPPFGAGQRIGLYGGSFDPAHGGHRQASLIALRLLRLDWVWWLVTPGNPLKDIRALPPLATRMARAAQIAAHPRIVITGVEAIFGTRYTADLIRDLKRHATAARFVWVMGSDNLVQFHRWENWRDIAEALPIAVINRPGSLNAALSANAARVFSGRRLDAQDAPLLADQDPPAWTFLTGPRSAASSTALRAADTP